jgi:hypothetical protein
MKKAFFLLFIILGLSVKAQNLVPNAGFEIKDTCPNSGDQIQYALGWSKYSTAITTPDYYNACSSPSTVGVPQSYFLFQPDVRGCGAYAGLGIWANTGSNDREQIGIQLSSPLVIGQKYFISFTTVMGGTNDGVNYYECASNNACLRLSTVANNSTTPAPIDNFAHLRSVSIINDTANWTRISGSIIADSSYDYLMLGNFYDDVSTDTLTMNCTNCLNIYSYYLFDNVCVSTDSLFCNGGIDALPCSVSVSELTNDNLFSVYPNPANSFCTIRSTVLEPFNVNIYNSLGQKTYCKNKISSNDLELDFTNYNKGIYYIHITTPDSQSTYTLLKQ